MHWIECRRKFIQTQGLYIQSASPPASAAGGKELAFGWPWRHLSPLGQFYPRTTAGWDPQATTHCFGFPHTKKYSCRLKRKLTWCVSSQQNSFALRTPFSTFTHTNSSVSKQRNAFTVTDEALGRDVGWEACGNLVKFAPEQWLASGTGHISHFATFPPKMLAID